VVASLLYYRHDGSFMSDCDFAQMCVRLSDGWPSGSEPKS
jgi:hypothetical protein